MWTASWSWSWCELFFFIRSFQSDDFYIQGDSGLIYKLNSTSELKVVQRIRITSSAKPAATRMIWVGGSETQRVVMILLNKMQGAFDLSKTRTNAGLQINATGQTLAISSLLPERVTRLSGCMLPHYFFFIFFFFFTALRSNWVSYTLLIMVRIA